MVMQHLHRGAHKTRDQELIGDLHLQEVIRDSSREDHTLLHRVGVVVLTLGDSGIRSASSSTSPTSLRGVPPHLLVRVVTSNLVHLLLVEDLVEVLGVFHVDSLGTLQLTTHNVHHSIQDRGLQRQSLQWVTQGDHIEFLQ